MQEDASSPIVPHKHMFGTVTKPIIYHTSKSQSSILLVQQSNSFQEHEHLDRN